MNRFLQVPPQITAEESFTQAIWTAHLYKYLKNTHKSLYFALKGNGTSWLNVTTVGVIWCLWLVSLIQSAISNYFPSVRVTTLFWAGKVGLHVGVQTVWQEDFLKWWVVVHKLSGSRWKSIQYPLSTYDLTVPLITCEPLELVTNIKQKMTPLIHVMPVFIHWTWQCLLINVPFLEVHKCFYTAPCRTYISIWLLWASCKETLQQMLIDTGLTLHWNRLTTIPAPWSCVG